MIGLTLFSVGSLTIYTYGFFFVIAIVLSAMSMYFAAKKKGISTEHLIEYLAYIILFGIVGARISYYLLYPSQFTSFIDIFKIWQGGLVSYGGFIFATVALIIAIKNFKDSILPWLDIFLLSALLGLAIGRFGSFLSGEMAGLPYSGIFSVQGLFPVTLAEALWNFIVFVILSSIFYSKNTNLKPGILALEVLMLYSMGRFIIEFFRNESTIIVGLTLSQLVLVIIFVVSVSAFISRILFEKKGVQNVR